MGAIQPKILTWARETAGLSIDAAAAMFRRLKEECRPFGPASFLALDEATLRRCGFPLDVLGNEDGDSTTTSCGVRPN